MTPDRGGQSALAVLCTISIRDLVETVARITRFQGRITQDTTRPDGTLRKLMDVGRLADMGWGAKIGLEDGIRGTYEWFLEQDQGAIRAK